MQSCRLIERSKDSLPWQPGLCQTCPVPDILRANGSDTLVLDGKVVKKFFGFKQEVVVEGWCSECFSAVPDPKRGCPNCGISHHPSIFDLEERPD